MSLYVTDQTVRAAARSAGLRFMPTQKTVENAWGAAYGNRPMPGDPYDSLRTALAAYCSANGTMQTVYMAPWEHWERDEAMRDAVGRRLRIDLAEAAMRASRCLVGPLREVRMVAVDRWDTHAETDSGHWRPLRTLPDGRQVLPAGMPPEHAMHRLQLSSPTRPLVQEDPDVDLAAPDHATEGTPEMYLFGA